MPFLQGATIFDYCERGLSSAFWAEPLNAVTNGGFVLAALAGTVTIAKRASNERSLWQIFFVLNFIAIGVGSFLFHTVPNVDTALADTGPIGVFMLTYLIFALRRLAGATWVVTALAIAAFIGVIAMAFKMQCLDGRMGFSLDVPPGAQAKCLNGSLGYGPALVAMWLIAAWLGIRRHPGGASHLRSGANVPGVPYIPLARSTILRRLGRSRPPDGNALHLASFEFADAVPASCRRYSIRPSRRTGSSATASEAWIIDLCRFIGAGEASLGPVPCLQIEHRHQGREQNTKTERKYDYPSHLFFLLVFHSQLAANHRVFGHEE